MHISQAKDGASAIEAVRDRRVVCIGDVMLDRYVSGRVDRISPEAPIPVLHAESECEMLGGAGNVARNLARLGVQVRLLGTVGSDADGATIERLAGESGIATGLARSAERPTTVKTRFVAGNQQMLRVDREMAGALADEAEAALVAETTCALDDADAVVVSDYAKGTLTPRVLATLLAAARERGLPVAVDPKGRDYDRYRGATVVTPNLRELADVTGAPVAGDAAVAGAGRHLIARHAFAAVIATRSQEGMSLVERETVEHYRARAREVYDVSGAGDTVVAVVGACLAGGVPLRQAARLANLAGGIVVAKRGTAVVTPDELVEAALGEELAGGLHKVLTREGARVRVRAWREAGLRVGFTNGCFDLLHPGHVALMTQARAACDRLVVGLNADASVRRLKGEGRPVQDEGARAAVLAALADVDAVVVFEEDTPLTLIEALRPDVLVKGADYTREQVVGGDLVESWGGRVVLAQLAEGHSTTRTVGRIAGR